MSDRAAPEPVRRLTADEVRSVVERYEAGATTRELATDLGVHRTTVAQALDRAGVPRRAVGLPPVALSDAVRLYTEGWSTARIGEQ